MDNYGCRDAAWIYQGIQRRAAACQPCRWSGGNNGRRSGPFIRASVGHAIERHPVAPIVESANVRISRQMGGDNHARINAGRAELKLVADHGIYAIRARAWGR